MLWSLLCIAKICSSAIGLNNTGIFLFIILIPFLVSVFISNGCIVMPALQSADFQRGF